MEKFPEYMRLCYENDAQKQLEGLIGIRKITSVEVAPPLQQIIDSGVVPRLLSILSQTSIADVNIQSEIVWILTNLASGSSEQTTYLTQIGAVQQLLPLLNIAIKEEVMSQAVWALGNIAGDSIELRNYLLTLEIIPKLLTLLSQTSIILNSATLNNITWTISNCLRGNPSPPTSIRLSIIEILSNNILKTSHGESIIAEALWSIYYASDKCEDVLREIERLDILPLILKFCLHDNLAVLFPALRVIGNFSNVSDRFSEYLLSKGGLEILKQQMTNTGLGKKLIIKEIFWTISNLSSGSRSQIQQILQSGILQHVFFILQHDHDVEIRKEAIWMILNYVHSATNDQIKSILQLYHPLILPIMIECLLCDGDDEKFVSVALHFFEKILEVSSSFQGDPFKHLILQSEYITPFVSNMNNLRVSPKNGIRNRVEAIITKYFENPSSPSPSSSSGISTSSPSVSTNCNITFNLIDDFSKMNINDS